MIVAIMIAGMRSIRRPPDGAGAFPSMTMTPVIAIGWMEHRYSNVPERSGVYTYVVGFVELKLDEMGSPVEALLFPKSTNHVWGTIGPSLEMRWIVRFVP